MFGKRKNNKDLIERFEVISKEFLDKCKELKRAERELKSLTRKIYNETNANYEFENQNLNTERGVGGVFDDDLMSDGKSVNLEEDKSFQNKNSEVTNSQSVDDENLYYKSAGDKNVCGKDLNNEVCGQYINGKELYGRCVDSKGVCGKGAGGDNVGNGVDSSKVNVMSGLDIFKKSVLEKLDSYKESGVNSLGSTEENTIPSLDATKESGVQGMGLAKDVVGDIESRDIENFDIESGEAGGDFLDEHKYKIDLQKSQLIEEYLKNLASKNESQPVFLTGGSKKIVYQKQVNPPKNLKSAGEYVLKNYFK